MTESLIYQSPKSKIYLVEDGNKAQPVALKILNYEFPEPSDISKFFIESDLLSGLQIEGVRNVIKTGKVKNRHAIYLEWFEGKPIIEVFKNKEGDIPDFLHIAIAVSKAIFNIHQHQIIHKDISGGNVLVNLSKRQVKIIDFGIASKFALKHQHLGNPDTLEGTLTYNSPEQTGRMNRIVDYRTDLYSMGILFYQMITGKLPFNSEDPLELVHSHIAQMPTPVHEILPTIPKQIGRIINKLLAKNAENRYQSGRGVRLDLENCLEQFEKTGTIEPFPVGQKDYSGKFQIPQKLYGRQNEIEQIQSVFNQCAEGSSELLMIAGYSGTGKSALVHELHKPITAKRGFFIEGKFDQYQRAVPYFAILRALEELIDILLIEPEEKLKNIKSDILAALGLEGKVLTNVLPKLEYIIGEQPELPELGGAEARNRFFYVLKKFVHAIARREHPIAMFIDDLQWADSASLNLLNILMTDQESSFLLCIGAYRDNEVGPAHPLLKTLEEIEEGKGSVSTITIGNLSKDNVRQLIRESVDNGSSDSDVLTDLVNKKTIGNAFFVNHFLKSLYEDGLLFFNFENNVWNWDIQKIEAKNISENVVELLAKKIRQLPENTGQALKAAACIGASFDLNTLSFILDPDKEKVKTYLTEALKEGMVIFDGNQNYKFSHDRIQQAVYSLIPENDKNRKHWDIGKLLKQQRDEDEQSVPLFEVVNQLNFGLNFIEENEKEEFAELNLEAGKLAKLNSAFPQALDYFRTGIRLLHEYPRTNQNDLFMDLHTEATEAAYLSGDFETMEVLYKKILHNSEDVLKNIKANSTRILAYKAENKLLDSIRVGMEVMEKLGEKFPKNPRMHHILTDYAKTLFALRGIKREDLLNLPGMIDPYKKAAIRMMNDLMSSAYWAIPNLSPLLVFRMIRLSLKYGSHPNTPFALGTYGVLQCGIFGNMRKGQEFLNSSIALMNKLDNKECKAQIHVNYSLIPHWNEHARNALEPLKESYRIGLETGAIEFACVNTNLYCINAFLIGTPLIKLQSETNAFSESYKELKQKTNYLYNQVFHQAMLNLMGKSDNPLKLTGEAYDEDKMIAHTVDRHDKTGEFFIWFNKMILAYFFGDYQNGDAWAVKSRDLLDAVLAKFEIPNHHFYEALIYLALISKASKSKQRKYRSRIRKNIKKLKIWSKFAPENYLHKVYLLEAEKARLESRFSEAGELYDKAIDAASEQNFIHEEAIAYELTGRFYLERKSTDLARHYFKSAHKSYRQWGAIEKVEQLEQQYSAYIADVASFDPLTNTMTLQTGSKSIQSKTLDIASVLKASTAISGEVVLSKLLSLLMEIVLENAGAQRGFLLLKESEELFIEAHSDVRSESTKVLQHIPLNETNLLSVPIVKYVQRTSGNVVLNDAPEDSRFQNDSYIKDKMPRSIICLPIINQGKFIGVLYLENNATTFAFTKNRIDMLNLLSGQIAVSIDNAILYEQMEQKVKDRTIELAAEKEKSDNLLYNILPLETAEELKTHGKAKTRKFESVTVLFTDFVGFTRISTQLSPEELVDILGTCFSVFDEIIQRYKVEKIKTIGDAYMAAGGLPIPNSTNAEDSVGAALEMRDWISSYNKILKKKGLPIFEIRIGLHTGPIVAGVVGTKKFAYDIWGDVVNTASRLESNSEPGKINISGETFELIKHKFSCDYRGKIKAKNKGEIDMYFVE